MDYIALGSRIKNKRLSLNMTQEKLAELVDISAVYVGQIERGDRHMTLDILLKISEVLDVSIEELLKDNTMNNINSRISELVNLVKTLAPKEIDTVIKIVNALYK